MRRATLALVLTCGLLALPLIGSCRTTAADGARVRPVRWAQPVIGTPLDNLHQVSAELYRCEQPSASDMLALEALGIRAVVNLRALHSDQDEVRGTGLVLIEVPMHAGELQEEELVMALRALLEAPKPVAVHCWHGSDRTGAVVAAWRVAVEDWSPQEALDEMTAGGFGHHERYENLRTLVLGLEREELRKKLGLDALGAHDARIGVNFSAASSVRRTSAGSTEPLLGEARTPLVASLERVSVPGRRAYGGSP